MNKRLKETMEKQQKAISKRVGPGKSLDVKGLIKVLNFLFFIEVVMNFNLLISKSLQLLRY